MCPCVEIVCKLHREWRLLPFLSSPALLLPEDLCSQRVQKRDEKREGGQQWRWEWGGGAQPAFSFCLRNLIMTLRLSEGRSPYVGAPVSGAFSVCFEGQNTDTRGC